MFVGVVGQAHPSWAHLLTGGVGEFVIRLSLYSVRHHDYTRYLAKIRSIVAQQRLVISKLSQCGWCACQSGGILIPISGLI